MSDDRQKRALVLIIAASAMVFPFWRSFAKALPPSPAEGTRLQLERQLADIEGKISGYERDLTQVRSEKDTLAREIKQLGLQRDALALKIQATTLEFDDIQARLARTETQIKEDSLRLGWLKSQMAAFIREMEQRDRVSFLEIVVTSKNLSEFYQELNGFEKVDEGLRLVSKRAEVETEDLQRQEQQLSDQRQQEQDLATLLDLQNRRLSDNLSERNGLLKKTRGQEAAYQAMLKDSKKKALEIRNRIYVLLEVGRQITFGEALTIARWASDQTGVRPAFLMAILTQESNLGKNVGTCNRAGDPPSKRWKAIMKPDRDQQPFLTITAALGRNPDATPVSCPMRDARGDRIGWGGAMGPAQFIPSTWIGYQSRLASLTGKPADPWDIRDAFLASALKLEAGGAGSPSGEWDAAMRYFSGVVDVRYRFYGDDVAATASQYQDDIDALNR